VTQGGHVSFGGEYVPVPIMDYSGFAVDCQTWANLSLVRRRPDCSAWGRAGLARP